MKNSIKYLPAYFLLLLCLSCTFEEIVELPLNEKPDKIVIEGNVTDQPGPYFVKVTKSTRLAQTGDVPVVENAKVVLNDNNGQTETLIFANGLYHTTNFVSHPGNTYHLSVTVDGNTYTAKSTMPQPVLLNSLKQISRPSNYNEAFGIVPVFQDPPEQGNYYLFNLYPGYTLKKPSFFSDDIDNGKINSRMIPTETLFYKNDTVAVEMQSIDAAVFSYYQLLSQAYVDNSGGTSPFNPPGNISNGGLGYFSAHTSQKKTIIIN